MNKTKIAVWIQDLEYQMRFVNCFMNHYSSQYELHVFSERKQLLDTNPKQYAVIITGEYNTNEMAEFVERGEILVCLTEDSATKAEVLGDRVIQVEKYQEVYRIVEVLERLLADKVSARGGGSHKYKCIGIYSLDQEMYQLPFTALLANILGEQNKVLVIDLQQYSGLGSVEEGMNSMGLEDLLSVVMSGNYSRSRMLECIRHEAGWDYVCALQNEECLAEGTREIYHSLIELMISELGYQTILLNFGTAFQGQLVLMEECDEIYLLCEMEDTQRWRENTFFQHLSRQGRDTLVQRISKIQIPMTSRKETSWRSLADKWNWGSLGEELRRGLEKEETYGAVM